MALVLPKQARPDRQPSSQQPSTRCIMVIMSSNRDKNPREALGADLSLHTKPEAASSVVRTSGQQEKGEGVTRNEGGSISRTPFG